MTNAVAVRGELLIKARYCCLGCQRRTVHPRWRDVLLAGATCKRDNLPAASFYPRAAERCRRTISSQRTSHRLVHCKRAPAIADLKEACSRR